MEHFYNKEYSNLVLFAVKYLHIEMSTAQDIVQQSFLDTYKEIDWSMPHSKIKNYIIGRIKFSSKDPKHLKRCTGMNHDFKRRNMAIDAEINHMGNEEIIESPALASESNEFADKEFDIVCDEIKESLSGVALEIFKVFKGETPVPAEIRHLATPTDENMHRFSRMKRAICAMFNFDDVTYSNQIRSLRSKILKVADVLSA